MSKYDGMSSRLWALIVIASGHESPLIMNSSPSRPESTM